ncbi:uncharacterized protein L3040_000071 [Drepanopeziza brunnea f. sp. 'multigermtubi']|uniref:uncharacterized protein n=1 Tax=Drepanopeziza brunnea f. sp. 'multigermtubi' TaxID=698441 RepID=UPI0023A4531A|nr:hypothetical protein L3040_000071 [Drepanopeziza brunnea f. sp. 'multigermtubi']
MLLLSLIHIWGGQDIPTLMLHRVAQPQKRWNIQGEIEEAASQGLLRPGTRDGQETISLPPSVQEGLRGTITDADRVRALTYLCQSFPGDKDLEPCSQTLRRLHLRVIQHVTEFVVDLVERRLLSSQQQLDFADVLLESSKLADASSKGHDWRFKAVDIAEKILASHPNHILHISAIIRRKALSRLITGKIYHEPVLSGIPLTAQSNALLWDLRLSKAQDYVEDDDFTGAQQEISHFVSFGPSQASTLENLFPPGAELHDSLIYLLVGVNCELRNPTEALRLAEAPARHPKTQSRRMNVLLAEAHLHVGMEACRLSNSRPSPTSLTEARLLSQERDRVAQVERVAPLRVASVLARISTLETISCNGEDHVNQAREKWIHVLEAVDRCAWRKPGYMEGICHYSIAALEMRCGQLDASQRHLQTARTLLEASGFRNLIVGLGALWFGFIGDQIAGHGGCRIQMTPDTIRGAGTGGDI